MRVYLACPLQVVARARTVASVIRGAGFPVVSRWHDGNGSIPYVDRAFLPRPRQRALMATSPDARDRLDDLIASHAMNLIDLEAADVIVALTHDDADGHALGRQTYVEIGQAIALGRPLVWSTEHGGATLAQVHGLVRLVAKDEWILPVLEGIAMGGGGEEDARPLHGGRRGHASAGRI